MFPFEAQPEDSQTYLYFPIHVASMFLAVWCAELYTCISTTSFLRRAVMGQQMSCWPGGVCALVITSLLGEEEDKWAKREMGEKDT